jgi:hypothetical protein
MKSPGLSINRVSHNLPLPPCPCPHPSYTHALCPPPLASSLSYDLINSHTHFLQSLCPPIIFFPTLLPSLLIFAFFVLFMAVPPVLRAPPHSLLTYYCVLKCPPPHAWPIPSPCPPCPHPLSFLPFSTIYGRFFLCKFAFYFMYTCMYIIFNI